ncbi:hypothetical protein N9L31_00160 [bacterium]|nr:hypothetical protein [bacterium]
MRFVAVVAAAFLLCAGGGAAQKIDISDQLRGLDVPEGLQQFLGAMVTEMQGLKNENAELQKEQKRTRAVEVELRQDNTVVQAKLEQVTKDKEALENKTQIMEAELRQENAWLKHDRDALQNKTQIIEGQLFQEKKRRMQLSIEVREVQSALYQFSNKTNTDYTSITVRLDQCEANTSPFIQEMNRRRIQEDTLCRGSGLTAMFQACCPSGSLTGHGHRILQLSEGCDALPETCSASCAPLFIEYFEGCQEMLDDLAPDQRQMFVGFYGGCQEVEQAAAAMLEDARPAMIFHVVVMSEAEAQQTQMFGGGSAPAPPVGPVPLSPNPARGAEIAQEFRRVCTTANLTVCVPQCNRLTYGFLLSIEIDGRGTVMTCNVMDGLYAWVGQASLGGYIGDVFAAFFSSVISGASGTYMVKITENHDVHTDLTIEPGQVVVINGDHALPQEPTWGSGSFTVGELASLSLSYMQIDTLIAIDEGAMAITLINCLLTFTDTLLLHNDMHATFIGMNSQFGGNPSWVVTKSGEMATGQVCDADGTNCVEDLCSVVSCGVGGGCTSRVGACECRTQHDGYSGDRCETHTCCSSAYNFYSADCHYAAGPHCHSCHCPSSYFYCHSCPDNFYCHLDYCDATYAGWDAQCDRTC